MLRSGTKSHNYDHYRQPWPQEKKHRFISIMRRINHEFPVFRVLPSEQRQIAIDVALKIASTRRIRASDCFAATMDTLKSLDMVPHAYLHLCSPAVPTL